MSVNMIARLLDPNYFRTWFGAGCWMSIHPPYPAAEVDTVGGDSCRWEKLPAHLLIIKDYDHHRGLPHQLSGIASIKPNTSAISILLRIGREVLLSSRCGYIYNVGGASVVDLDQLACSDHVANDFADSLSHSDSRRSIILYFAQGSRAPTVSETKKPKSPAETWLEKGAVNWWVATVFY